MIYDIFLSGAAVADIERSVEWYENQRKGLGYEFELCVEAGITFLQRNPLVCQKKYNNIRAKYIKRFPYGLYYEIDESTVKIIGVFHMKQNPLQWEDRHKQKKLK